MATKQVKRYEVMIVLSEQDDGTVQDCKAAAPFWVPEVSTRGGASVTLEGDEVNALLALAKSAIESKLAEDGSTVEGI